MILTQTCVCSTTWILECAVSVFQKCEGDLATEEERKPQRTQRPLPVKHLRWQFAFPGGRKLPGQREQGRPGLQVLTEAGIVPSGDGRGGLGGTRKGHVHIVNIYTHTLRLSLPAM